MDAQRNELTIDDVMADPLIGVVMKADGIAPTALRALLDQASDARKGRGRCLDFSFGRVAPRASRPWAGVTAPTHASVSGCRTPLPW